MDKDAYLDWLEQRDTEELCDLAQKYGDYTAIYGCDKSFYEFLGEIYTDYVVSAAEARLET